MTKPATEERKLLKRGNDGRFEHIRNWQRMCVCGHTLGVHGAGSPADCLLSSLPDSDRIGEPGLDKPNCGCQKFRLSRKKGLAA